MSTQAIEQALQEIDWLDMLSDAPRRQDLSCRRKREDDEFLVRYKTGFNDGKEVQHILCRNWMQ